MLKCPGQDTAYWKPDDIYDLPCPVCGSPVEFMKTDAWRPCASCGWAFRNAKMELGCAQWCSYAKQCLGYEPEKPSAQPERGELLERVVGVVRSALGSDRTRLARALLTLGVARELARDEEANGRVTAAAALAQALVAHHRTASLTELLTAAGMTTEDAEHVAGVVAEHRSSGPPASLEARIIRDAVALATMTELLGAGQARPELARVAGSLKTAAGRRKAAALLAQQGPVRPILPAV